MQSLYACVTYVSCQHIWFIDFLKKFEFECNRSHQYSEKEAHDQNQNSRKMLEKMTFNREKKVKKKTNIDYSDVMRKIKTKIDWLTSFSLALPLSLIYIYKFGPKELPRFLSLSRRS